MINQKQKKVLIMALYAGEIMMKSGAEIYRVEDTITRICKACGIPYVEAFATTTGIFVSVDEGSDDTDMHTFIKRIKGSKTDLEKISRVNAFSREFSESGMTIEEGRAMLKEIDETAPFSFCWRVVGATLISSFFTAMLGGDLFDFGSALLVGAFSYFATILLDRLELNIFIRNFCACAVVTLLSLSLVGIGLGHNLNHIIVGSIMMFLPGVAITNAVRDTLTGDMVAGLSRATEAFLTAVSIAAGVGVVLKVFDVLGGVF